MSVNFSEDWFLEQRGKTIEELIEVSSVADLIQERDGRAPSRPHVHFVDLSTKVHDVLAKLSEHRILSVPVLDKDANQWIGSIDMFDILSWVLKTAQQVREVQTETGTFQLKTWCQDASELTHKGEALTSLTLKEALKNGLSKRNPFCLISLKSKLSSLLRTFQRGVHRVVVVNEHNHLLSVVSQSDFLGWVARHHQGHLGPLATTNLNDIGIGVKPPITISCSTNALHAFWLMQKHGISAVGVVHSRSGELLANISIADLRGLPPSNFGKLLLPTLEFLKEISCPITPPVSCSTKNTFDLVILKLAASRVHRVWVVDELGKPTGIISLTDCMKLFDLRVYVDECDKHVVFTPADE